MNSLCISDIIDIIIYDETVEIDINLFISIIKENLYCKKLIKFNNQELYLLEICLSSNFIYGLLEHNIDDFDIVNFYSFLFNYTSPESFNITQNTNRCHWIAQCIHLKNYDIAKKIIVYKKELILQDIMGNTPLHYALKYKNKHLIHKFKKTPLWIKNNSNTSLLQLSNSILLYNEVLLYYKQNLNSICKKYNFNNFIKNLIIKKLIIT